MIRHILLLRFNQSAELPEINRLKDVFTSLPNKIEGVLSVEWGENDSPEGKNQGYTHSVLMTFVDDVFCSKTVMVLSGQHNSFVAVESHCCHVKDNSIQISTKQESQTITFEMDSWLQVVVTVVENENTHFVNSNQIL